MKKQALLLFSALTLSVGGANQVFATTILDLGTPTLPPVPYQSNDLGNLDRSVVFDALTNFTVSSFGIKMDPFETVGATSLSVTIYSVTDAGNPSANNGTGNRGAQLATASAGITDVGWAFYDIPIAFSFTSGNRYDVAFDTPGGFGAAPNLKNWMEFTAFDPSLVDYAPFSVDGTVSVVDGGYGGDYRNHNFPHTRLTMDGGDDQTVIPEPSTYLSLGAGLLLLGYLRSRK